VAAGQVAGGDDALAAVPALGENGEVILGALGLAADQIAALRVACAV